MFTKTKRGFAFALLAGLAALAAAAGIGYAAIPDGNAVYNACRLKATGTIRLIDKSLPSSSPLGRCHSQYEEEISWNQTGPQGLKGEPGVQGAAGPAGPAGPAGAVGPAGPAGPTGPAGRAGEDGTDGAPGAAGAAGRDGVSVASAALAAGDANCPAGGSRFTAANGVTFACNGTNGSATAKAPDADKLDGLDSLDFKVGCRPGFRFFGGMCWEAQDVNGFTFVEASARCGTMGGRLPLYTEFAALIKAGMAVGMIVVEDWTGSSAGDDSSIYINSTNADNFDGTRPNNTSSYVRCVVPPQNALGTP